MIFPLPFSVITLENLLCHIHLNNMPKNKQTSLQIRLLMLYSGTPNQIQKYESNLKHINLITERRLQSLDSFFAFFKNKIRQKM